MNEPRGVYLLGVGAVLVVLVLAAWQISKSPAAAIPPDSIGTPAPAIAVSSEREPLIVKIEEGESADSIAEKLEKAGVIRSALQFRVLVALQGAQSDLGAGEYRFERGMASSQVIDILINGYANFGRRVTIPEGLRSEEIGDILEEKGIISKADFLQAAAKDYRSQYDFLKDLPPDAALEGFLFPDTYDFAPNATAEDIVRQMLDNFGLRFASAKSQAASSSNLTVYQTVTLASIVEREATTETDNPLIAGVFMNRLNLGMLLDADPTVQYALANNAASVSAYGYWKRDLTADDLRIDSPYNTRRYAGLPPGPIANPGASSLAAALNPTDTDYLYFVAKPDGSHAFAETLQEHIANIQLYQN